MRKRQNFIAITIVQIVLLIIISLTISNIYNTGIENKGFKDLFFREITTETFDKLQLLMTSEDFNYYDSCYKFDKDKNIYVLKKTNKKELIRINKEVLPIHYLYYEALQTGNYEKNILGISAYKNMYNILKGLNEKQREVFLSTPKAKINKYSQNKIEQLCIKDLQVESKRIGNDINKTRDKYILNNIIIFIFSIIILIITSKKTSSNNKQDILIQNILLLSVSLIFIYIINKLVFIILFFIYSISYFLLYFTNKKRYQKESINEFLYKIEERLNNQLFIKEYYKNKIIIPIIILVSNVIIYLAYTSYRLFSDIKPFVIANWIIILIFIIYSFIEYISSIIIQIDNNKENRPKLKTKKQDEPDKIKNIDKKKKTKKKKKKKKSKK